MDTKLFTDCESLSKMIFGDKSDVLYEVSTNYFETFFEKFKAVIKNKYDFKNDYDLYDVFADGIVALIERLREKGCEGIYSIEGFFMDICLKKFYNFVRKHKNGPFIGDIDKYINLIESYPEFSDEYPKKIELLKMAYGRLDKKCQRLLYFGKFYDILKGRKLTDREIAEKVEGLAEGTIPKAVSRCYRKLILDYRELKNNIKNM